jgi:hypothetical protein
MKPLVFVLMAALCAGAAVQQLGKPFAVSHPLTVSEVLNKPEERLGKPIQVRGKVTEVCQMKGCWMALVDDTGKSLRVKVNDGVIVIPKESVGKMAVAEGELKKIQLTKDQAIARAKHEAEEQGRKFDASKITSGQTIYQIQGTGILIENQ